MIKHLSNSLLLLILCLVTNTETKAQNRIYGKAALHWANKQGGEKSSRLLLVYDRASNELSAEIDLFPLIENSQQRDSASRSLTPLKLNMKGVLPYQQPESFSAASNEKQLAMDVTIQLGDSVEIRRISLILTKLQDNNTSTIPGTLDGSLLPCHANFVLVVDPGRFGLHKTGLKWIQKFIIEVENAIINKK